MQVRERNGRIYMKCFAGCETKEILRAANLTWSDILEPRPYMIDRDPMPFTRAQMSLLGLQTVTEKTVVGFCQTKQEIPQGLYSIYDPEGYAVCKESRYSMDGLWKEDKALFHQIVVGKLCSVYRKYCEMYNSRYYQRFSAGGSGVKRALETAIQTLNPVYFWYTNHQDVLFSAMKGLSELYGDADFNVPNSILSAAPAYGNGSTYIEQFNKDMHDCSAFEKIPKVNWEQDKKRYAII